MAGEWTAGSIVGKLNLNKSKWDSSVKAVKGQLKTLGGKAQAHSAQIKGMGRSMTMAGGVIVGAMGLMIKKYADAGDEVHKMAIKTGFSTEALSELKYAAEISGASLGSLDKGVKKMSKSLTDADRGLETYVVSFDRIGLSVEDLMALSPEEQFLKIADGIAELESPTLRAATAQEIFGRAGTELLPLFAEGSAGMADLRDKAKELGYSFDQEAADGAARLVDAQTDLKTAFSGVAISISQTLAPALSGLIEKFADTVAKVSDWIREHPKLTEIIAKGVLGFGALLTVLGPIMMMLPGIVVALPAIATGIAAILGPLGLVTAAAIAAYSIIKKLNKAKSDLADADERAAEATHNFGQKLRLIADEAGLTRKEFVELTRKYDGNTLALASAIIKGKEGVELQEAMKKVGKENIERIDKQKESLIKLDKEGFTPLALTIPEVMVETKTWIDYIAGMGLKTVKEKSDRVGDLEGYIDDLSQAYQDGKIDLTAYTKALSEAKGEIYELSTGIDDVALPAFRDMSGVLDTAVGEMTDRIPDITATVEEETGNIVDHWGALGVSISRNFGDAVEDLLTKGSDLKDGIDLLLSGIATSFKNMVGNMVTEFFANNVFDKMSSAAKSGEPAVTTFAGAATSLGAGITSLATGIASILPAIATAIASAAEILFAALPEIIAIGAAALALYAGFMAVNKLLGSGGGSKAMDATNRELHNIWEEARNTFQNTNLMVAQLDTLKTVGWTMQSLLAQIRDKLADGVGGGGGGTVNLDSSSTNNFLKQIRGNTALIREWTKRTFEALKGKSGGWATGFEGIVDQPIRPLIGEAGPEYVSVHPVSEMKKSASSPNVTINNNVYLNGTIITDREYTRNRMLPEIVSALEANLGKTRIKQILGIA